jgi:hypothetical protein
MSLLPVGANVYLGTWDNLIQYGAGPTTRSDAMTQAFGQPSIASQSTVMRLQPCTVKKIYVSTNSGEFTGGTMRFRLWKNVVRTGTADFDSGDKDNTSFTFPAVDLQFGQWYEVNIPMGEDDYFTAEMTVTAITGGPEGIYMQLWGVV